MDSSPGHCTSVCRICLAVDVPTALLSETPLQAIFEKVSNTPLHTDDMRPVEACLFCHSQLKKCWRLMLTSEKSENILTEISERCNMITKESIALVDRNVNGLCYSLHISKLECIDNLLPEIADDIKVEIKLEKEDKGSLHTEEVDISDVDIGEFDSDEENDLPLKCFSVAEQRDSKIESSNIKSADADATSAQKTETEVENEIKFDVIDIEEKSTNTINERQSPMNFLKPFKKSECNICQQWYPNKYMKIHVMTHTDIRPFECKVCRNRFRLIHHLKKHMETVHSVARNKTYKCDICSSKFRNSKEFLRHRKTHTYICDYCQQPFPNKAHLIQHLKMHTGKKIFECRICYVQFNNILHLNRHSRVVHNLTTSRELRTYKCSMCVSIFNNKKKYFKHLRTHTYECNDCHQKFKNKGNLTQHIRIHTGEYKCTICHIQFTNKDFLSRHTRFTHHNMTVRKKVTNPRCDLCGSKFNNRKDFFEHARMHKYKCDHCQEEYPKKAHLIKHLNIHVEKRQYKCGICQWRFKTKASMSRHLKSHEEPSGKLHECQICQRGYNLEADLITHLKTHTTEKLFECDICQRRYISKNLLTRHQKIHTRQKTLECEFCLKLFATKQQLRNHKRAHTGEKPYKCSVCLRRFAHKNYLNIHYRSHTGEKPYACKLCTARFADRSGLRGHSRVHTGEAPVKRVKCEICEKRFAKNCELVEHYRKHTGERPFTCTLCDGRFVSNRSLNRHLKLRRCS